MRANHILMEVKAFGWSLKRFLLIYYYYSTHVLSTDLELGRVKLKQTNLTNTVW